MHMRGMLPTVTPTAAMQTRSHESHAEVTDTKQLRQRRRAQACEIEGQEEVGLEQIRRMMMAPASWWSSAQGPATGDGPARRHSCVLQPASPRNWARLVSTGLKPHHSDRGAVPRLQLAETVPPASKASYLRGLVYIYRDA
eukprot:6211513-Pleurochrysis_carterae.AAC.1